MPPFKNYFTTGICICNIIMFLACTIYSLKAGYLFIAFNFLVYLWMNGHIIAKLSEEGIVSSLHIFCNTLVYLILIHASNQLPPSLELHTWLVLFWALLLTNLIILILPDGNQ